jgi:transcriptional regulator with XRE-family HTH domain
MEAHEMGQIISKRRLDLRLDQQDLAEMSGITVKTLYLIEKGIGNPSFNTLNKILDLLGLTIQVEIKKVNE